MNRLSLGDLSQSFQLRRDNVQVRGDLQRLTHELSTGKHSDLGKAVSGNFGPLISMDRQLARIEAFDLTAREAGLFMDAAQNSMDRIQSIGDELAPRLIASELTGHDVLNQTVAADARAAFATTIDMLNSKMAGRGIFGGASTNRPALASAEDMLTDIKAELALAGANTAGTVRGVVDTWFGPGGRFETIGYIGSDTRLSSFQVGESTTVEMRFRADDDAMREQLKGLAMGALLADGPLAGNYDEKAALAKMAGTAIVANQTTLSALRADLGTEQARIESASTRNGSEAMALKLARNDIVALDPYETATELQNTQTQLETIYTLTARLSRLNLTDFLR